MTTKKELSAALSLAGRAARYFRRTNEILHARVCRMSKSPLQRLAVEFFYQGDRAGGGFELVANMLGVVAKDSGARAIHLCRAERPSQDVPAAPRPTATATSLLGAWQLGLWWNLYTLQRFSSNDNPEEMLGQLQYLALRLKWLGERANLYMAKVRILLSDEERKKQ